MARPIYAMIVMACSTDLAVLQTSGRVCRAVGAVLPAMRCDRQSNAACGPAPSRRSVAHNKDAPRQPTLSLPAVRRCGDLVHARHPGADDAHHHRARVRRAATWRIHAGAGHGFAAEHDLVVVKSHSDIGTEPRLRDPADVLDLAQQAGADRRVKRLCSGVQLGLVDPQ